MARKGLEFGWVLWSGRITDAVCEQSRVLERVWEGVGKGFGRGSGWVGEGIGKGNRNRCRSSSIKCHLMLLYMSAAVQ